jgi:hypothetical protein
VPIGCGHARQLSPSDIHDFEGRCPDLAVPRHGTVASTSQVPWGAESPTHQDPTEQAIRWLLGVAPLGG